MPPVNNEYPITKNSWDAYSSPEFVYRPNLHLNATISVVNVSTSISIDLAGMPDDSFVEFYFGNLQASLNTEILCFPSPLLVGYLCKNVMNFEKINGVLYYSEIANEEKNKGGNMNTSVYDKDNNGSVDLSDALADGAIVDGGSFIED